MSSKATLRSDGRYVLKRVIDGKTKYFYGRSPDEVEEKARAAHAHNITNNDTLKTWMDYWLENVMQPNIENDTHENYKSLIEKHITGDDVSLGQKRLRDITTQDIRLFLNKKGETMSPQSVLKLHFFIKSSLQQASHDGVILKSPAAVVKRPKLDPKKNKYLDTDTVRMLIELATRHKTMLLVAWTSGLRREELLGLYWTDIEKGRLTVRRAIKKGKRIDTNLKTKAAYRTIPLPKETIDELAKYKTRTGKKEKEKRYGCQTDNSEPYFPRRKRRSF